MAGINANTAVQFIVQGSTGEWVPRTPDDVRSNAVAAMSRYGTVLSLTINKEAGRLPISGIDLWDWRYTATGTLRTSYSHASLEDVRSIIAGAFWGAAGEQVTVSFPGYGEIAGAGVSEPSSENKYLTVGAITIVAAVGVAVFVLKRG